MQRFPANTCTIMDEEHCKDCPLKADLKCRFTRGHLLRFITPAFIFMLLSGAGMIVNGFYWQLGVWVLFLIVFFTLWEIRILCSHCPFYAEDANTLHCIANYGSPKVWKYHPEPMSQSEKIQLLIGFGLFGGWNLIWLISAGDWVFAGLHLVLIAGFFTWLTQRVCNQCVNFSCPLNHVPKPIVDAYLRRNPIMKDAWVKSGYQLDE